MGRVAAVAAVTGIAALVVAMLSYNRSKDSIEQARRSADRAERKIEAVLGGRFLAPGGGELYRSWCPGSSSRWCGCWSWARG
ncbi:hypothetical protein GCM10010187_55710 [Actinomadura coerulea]|nr:hypothetical protein GCM10010187_55710 [Actinomadura coerulea]